MIRKSPTFALSTALAAAVLVGCASQAGTARAAAARVVDTPPAPRGLSLGWYDGIKNTETPGILAAEGIDLVMPYIGKGDPETIEAFLDAAEAAGIGVALEIPRALALNARGPEFDRYVLAYAGRRAVRAWYLYDEPEWKLEATPKKLRIAYRRLKELDPRRPVCLVFMFPDYVRRYIGAMDELWFDRYPVKAGGREFAGLSDGRYARRMAGIADIARAHGLVSRVVLQGYGEDEAGVPQFGRRLPSFAETRYMLHAALLAHPAGLLFWARYRSREEWVSATLAPALDELRARFPAGIEYGDASAFSFSGAPCDAALLLGGDGRTYLMLLGKGAEDGTAVVAAPPPYLLGPRQEERFAAELRAFAPFFIEVSVRGPRSNP